MINKTIVEGLKPYAVGEKLRTLRLKKSMGRVELGQHTGLSPAMLSKRERGKLFPRLPTLLRIAMVFGVGLDFFFADERKRRVVSIVRKPERLKFPENAGASVIAYNFESLVCRFLNSIAMLAVVQYAIAIPLLGGHWRCPLSVDVPG